MSRGRSTACLDLSLAANQRFRRCMQHAAERAFDALACRLSPAANGNTTREFPLLFEVINRPLTQGDHCQQLLFADEHFARLPRFFFHTELLVLSHLRFDYCPIFPEHSTDIYGFIPFKISILLSYKRIVSGKKTTRCRCTFTSFFRQSRQEKCVPQTGSFRTEKNPQM